MGDSAPVPAIEPAWCEEFVQRWITAWNAHDADQVLGLLTDDIVWDDPAWPHTMYGTAEARELLAHNWRAFPDLTFGTVDVPYVGSDGLRAAFHWRSSGTHLGPIDPPGFPATGKPINVDGVDLHEYRDGKIARLRIISNMNDVALQLGLLPAPGSRVEKALAAVRRLRSHLPGT